MIKEKDDVMIRNCIICSQPARKPPKSPVICPVCGKVIRPKRTEQVQKGGKHEIY